MYIYIYLSISLPLPAPCPLPGYLIQPLEQPLARFWHFCTAWCNSRGPPMKREQPWQTHYNAFRICKIAERPFNVGLVSIFDWRRGVYISFPKYEFGLKDVESATKFICILALQTHLGYHQKGLCKGYVLEWNIAQNLQKRRWPFKTKANLTTNVCW